MLWLEKSLEYYSFNPHRSYYIEYDITIPEQFGFRAWIEYALENIQADLDFASWIVEGVEDQPATIQALAHAIAFCVGRYTVPFVNGIDQCDPDKTVYLRRATNQWARSYKAFVWLRHPPERPGEDWRLLENTFSIGRCVEFRCVLHKDGQPLGSVAYCPLEAQPYRYRTGSGKAVHDAIKSYTDQLGEQIDKLLAERQPVVVLGFLWSTNSHIGERRAKPDD